MPRPRGIYVLPKGEMAMPPRWRRTTLRRVRRETESDGPGLLFILVALVAVAVAGARLLGFAPGSGTEPVQTRLVPPLDVSRSDVPADPTPSETEDAARSAATVIVYHTHGTENYSPAASHTEGGRAGHVVDVGRTFAAWLDDAGINAIHHTAVHDHPSWASAFANAAQAVSSLIHQQAEISAVFDIHRDAIESDVGKDFTTVQIDGRSVARILLVVGDQNNPYAQQNVEFAERLKAKMDALYPGLSRGIRVQRADYNGRLHPNAVQVFIGDYRYNTVDEANEAARLFARVVAELFR